MLPSPFLLIWTATLLLGTSLKAEDVAIQPLDRKDDFSQRKGRFFTLGASASQPETKATVRADIARSSDGKFMATAASDKGDEQIASMIPPIVENYRNIYERSGHYGYNTPGKYLVTLKDPSKKGSKSKKGPAKYIVEYNHGHHHGGYGHDGYGHDHGHGGYGGYGYDHGGYGGNTKYKSKGQKGHNHYGGNHYGGDHYGGGDVKSKSKGDDYFFKSKGPYGWFKSWYKGNNKNKKAEEPKKIIVTPIQKAPIKYGSSYSPYDYQGGYHGGHHGGGGHHHIGGGHGGGHHGGGHHGGHLTGYHGGGGHQEIIHSTHFGGGYDGGHVNLHRRNDELDYDTRPEVSLIGSLPYDAYSEPEKVNIRQKRDLPETDLHDNHRYSEDYPENAGVFESRADYGVIHGPKDYYHPTPYTGPQVKPHMFYAPHGGHLTKVGKIGTDPVSESQKRKLHGGHYEKTISHFGGYGGGGSKHGATIKGYGYNVDHIEGPKISKPLYSFSRPTIGHGKHSTKIKLG